MIERSDMPSAKITEKAERLVRDGRVRRLTPVEVFEVDGDSGRWTVVLAGGEFSCTCPASGECSHVEAAKLSRGTRAQPFPSASEALCYCGHARHEHWGNGGGCCLSGLCDCEAFSRVLTDAERAEGEAAMDRL